MKPIIGLHRLHKEASWWTPATFFALMAAILFLATGCGNKGGNTTPVYPYGGVGGYYGTPNCAGCAGTQSALAAGIGETLYGGQIGSDIYLEFYGTGGTAYTGQYMGMFAANGRIVVRAPNPVCGIAPGTYNVTTIQPGQWQMQMFGGAVLQATGPTQLQIQLSGQLQPASPYAQSKLDGRTAAYTIQGRLYWYGPGASIPCDDAVSYRVY